MARETRLDYPGFYHVVNRGVERRDIFIDQEDHEVFLGYMQESALTYGFEIYSFCLMDNHYHLLLKTSRENLSDIMKSINARYTIYFNKKYKRVGPLWQGRFKSWYVYDEVYLDTLIRYIEYNPVKAGVVDRIGKFFWSMSSYNVKLPMLHFELMDKIDFTVMFSDEEHVAINKLYNSKVDVDTKVLIEIKKSSLEHYFHTYSREFAIVHALKDGYKQTEIAHYLHLSNVAISKSYKIYREKVKLFEKLRDKGIFWSYAKDVTYMEAGEAILIEYVLKYGDFVDMENVFKLFGKRAVKRVWEKSVKNDKRFLKLNLMIARVFLSMNVESGFFKGGKNERLEKLRLLAS
ncbi:MAG: transposase [Campylobacterota bacterium]|nr:transposase [Campylobacterota bacterium]